MVDRSLDTVDDLPYALAVNVTSAFQTEPPEAALATILQKCPLLIDLNYRPKRTAFMNCGSAVAVNGLEMLLHQAARSFRLWTGVDMPVGTIRQVLMAD
jgi:shikimate dehydrogenase